MRLVHRKAAFLVVLMGLALEVAVTPGPAAAVELKRLAEHDGILIIRNLDSDVEFQVPLLSQRPSPWPEKEEAREEQQDPPEVRPETPQRRIGSIACNVTDRLADGCISNITVHRAGRSNNAFMVVHRPGRPDNRFMKVHRAARPDNRSQIVHRAGRSVNRHQIVHRAGGSDRSQIRVHGLRDRWR